MDKSKVQKITTSATRSEAPIRILPILSDEDPLKKKFSTRRICWKEFLTLSIYSKKKVHGDILFEWVYSMQILTQFICWKDISHTENRIHMKFSLWELIAKNILIERIHYF